MAGGDAKASSVLLSFFEYLRPPGRLNFAGLVSGSNERRER
jgi:hypothetical protein